MKLDWLFIAVILFFSFTRTVSYGTWTWKQKNAFGGLMLYLLAAASVVLPIFTLYSRR